MRNMASHRGAKEACARKLLPKPHAIHTKLSQVVILTFLWNNSETEKEKRKIERGKESDGKHFLSQVWAYVSVLGTARGINSQFLSSVIICPQCLGHSKANQSFSHGTLKTRLILFLSAPYIGCTNLRAPFKSSERGDSKALERQTWKAHIWSPETHTHTLDRHKHMPPQNNLTGLRTLIQLRQSFVHWIFSVNATDCFSVNKDIVNSST